MLKLIQRLLQNREPAQDEPRRASAGHAAQARASRVGAAAVFAAACALAAAGDTQTQETPAAHRPLQVTSVGEWIGNAVAYGPFRDGQSPGGPTPTRQQVAEDLTIMRPQWRLLRLYAANDTAATVLDVIRRRNLGMRVVVGAWIDPERETVAAPGGSAPSPAAIAANRRQVARAIALANAYPDVVAAVSVGNETQVSWSAHRVAPDVLLAYLRQVRRATDVPVTTADDYTFWLEPRSKPFAAEVDFIFTHIYAMWRGVELPDAVAFTRRQYAAVQSFHPDHQVVIGELGWATQKHTVGDQAKYIKGRPGAVAQKQFYDELLAWTTRQRVPNFFFAAFDEKWKGGDHPDEVEKHWGLYTSDRKPKLAMRSRLGIVDEAWRQRVCAAAWICYTPSNANPPQGDYPPEAGLRADLSMLREAGFTGLITYACAHPALQAVVPLAEAAGFNSVILGIWDPLSAAERAQAVALAERDLVAGICVGNEGLGSRYDYAALVRILDELRSATGKPVTTTEEFSDYLAPRMLYLGDWVFPNAHPVYHGRDTADAGIRWTAGAYEDLRRRADRFVWLKEVGWPSGGGEHFTPAAQQEYYTGLVERDVVFAYFEAFDQPWKPWHACEPHFGLFDQQRAAKPLAASWGSRGAPTLRCVEDSPTDSAAACDGAGKRERLYVYRDHGDAANRFTPSEPQGDVGDLTLDAAWPGDPYRGKTCLRIAIAAQGAGPNDCDYGPPCRWAGLRWLHPPGNWGTAAELANAGLDLRGYRRVVFWARADAPAWVSFMVGGVDEAYGDSLAFPARELYRVGPAWQRYEIDLTGRDLGHVIAGFGCASTWDQNPDGVTLYLDEVYFE